MGRDDPSWPDTGQRRRITSVVCVGFAVYVGVDSYLDWEIRPSAIGLALSGLVILVLLVIAIGVWEKRRW